MVLWQPAESTALICSPNADGPDPSPEYVVCANGPSRSMGAGRDDAPEEESPVISDRASSASISVHP
jgi:hypothetical protein